MEILKFNNYISTIWIKKASLFLGIPLYIFTGQYKSLTRYVGSRSLYYLISRNSILISKEEAIKNNLQYYFVSAWITLEIDSTLDSVGITSAFSKKLTKAGISCNVIAAYHHDHIFVPYIDKHKAMIILSDMYESQNN